MPYFRHKDKTECEYLYSEPETQEHLKGKELLYKWILQQENVMDVILEGWLPETKQRPDIMFKYNGKQFVIEYQCTPIASEYIERHELYQAAGINDIWILGTDKYIYKKETKKNFRSKVIENYSSYYFDSEYNLFLISVDVIDDIIKTKFKTKIVNYCDSEIRKNITEFSSIVNYNHKPLYVGVLNDMELNQNKIKPQVNILNRLTEVIPKKPQQHVNKISNERMIELNQYNKLYSKCNKVFKNIFIFFKSNYNIEFKNMERQWGFKYNSKYFALTLSDGYPYINFYKTEYIDNKPVDNLIIKANMDEIELLVIYYLKDYLSYAISSYKKLNGKEDKNS